MTLKELAEYLSEIYEFEYLVIDKTGVLSEVCKVPYSILIWLCRDEPEFISSFDGFCIKQNTYYFFIDDICIDLDIPRRDDGEIDYSKSLVKIDSKKEKKKMRPIELAKYLRKVFNFKYLLVENIYNQGVLESHLFKIKPEYKTFYYYTRDHKYVADGASVFSLASNIELDLSEYEDDNGNVDYSKCIVEV